MWKPTLADVLLVALLGWLLVHTLSGGATGLLVDTSVGLHVRYGDLQRESGGVPVGDPLSYTNPRAPVVRWEWLAENVFSRVHGALGLQGLILLAAALIVGSVGITMRRMAPSGALVTVLLAHLGIGAASVHFLARPLAFTLLLFALSLWILERGRARWMLVPLTALWANLHPGYLGLLITLAILAAGAALERSRQVFTYAALLAACAAASCVNPYGWRLPLSEIEYARALWPLEIVREYRAPSFRSAEGIYLQVLLVAGLFTAAALARRKEYGRALLLVAWAQAALTSVRHAPLYFLVAAPWIAAELARAASAMPEVLRGIDRDYAGQLGRNSLWPAAVLAALLFSGPLLAWPRDLPVAREVAALAERHRERLISTRTFTTDDWSGYLAYHYYPRFRYFLGAFVNACHREVTQEYLAVIHGAAGWDRALDRYQVTTLLVPSESAIASLARSSLEWRVVEDNGTALVAILDAATVR